jgi:carbamoyltransferase
LNNNFVLGIWDGHDAGAALLRENKIIFAINEERLTRRKLEVGFPTQSIHACLQFADLTPTAIKTIAASTTDPAKTMTRLLPQLKEEYYLIRRRKKAPHRSDPFKKAFKYRFTEAAPNFISQTLSRKYFHHQLQYIGFKDYELHLTNHHEAHAQAAACCSGFYECLVLTLDGVGDGLSGSIWIFQNDDLRLIKALPAKISLGIFFEHVTNLMNMRELEDEGKVMALANYAYPIADHENPLMKMIETRKLELISNYSSIGMFKELKRILWRYPSEQFAYMAQRALEKNALMLTENALAQTKMKRIAVSGGVFSNIKMNMKIAAMAGVENMFVFPHMGDGGLALGAAMIANQKIHGITRYTLNDLHLGPAFSPSEILDVLSKETKIRYRSIENAHKMAAQLILDGQILLWFQGRMEIGPRALGNRSILARPDDRGIKDRLNVLLKKRVWYQPFCPSMLIEDAPQLLEMDGLDIRDNRFMTMGFQVRKEHLKIMDGVINIDGTCRPQFVADENPSYRQLLQEIKKGLGYGIVLNTSFNIHGEPLACSPHEALYMLKDVGIRYLFMEDILVENLDAKNQ